MPELHKLTTVLGVLQDRGHKVALVTDGRMSGASGKVPAAIHVTPEALEGGAIGKVRDGDVVRLDAERGYAGCAGGSGGTVEAADGPARSTSQPTLRLRPRTLRRIPGAGGPRRPGRKRVWAI